MQVGGANILFSEGFKHTPAVSASLITGLEPIMNPLLVAIFYGEQVSALAVTGAVIVVCGQTTFMRKPFGQPDAPETEQPNMFWYEDCSAAAENILLAATANGLGAVWTAGYPATERIAPIAEALGLPDNVVPLCIIPVGVPAENPEPKDKWNPDNIHWEQW